MKFTLNQITGCSDDHEHFKEIEETIIETDRCTILKQLIFQYRDKFYKVYYSAGSTEYQDGCGTEYNELLDCEEVHQVEKLVKVWEKV